MRCEAPDLRFYTELRELNRGFLDLLIDGQQGSRPVLGLAAAIVDQLRLLPAAELDAVAATPCLLATLMAGAAPAVQSGVRDGGEFREARWNEATRVYAASLSTYIWQTVPRGPLLAALCGAAGNQHDGPGTYALTAVGRGEHRLPDARFRRHPRFWPDLVSAASTGNPERLRLARLTAVQLALHGDGRLAPRHPAAAPEKAAATTRPVARAFAQR